jgi:hypothetical protein
MRHCHGDILEELNRVESSTRYHSLNFNSGSQKIGSVIVSSIYLLLVFLSRPEALKYSVPESCSPIDKVTAFNGSDSTTFPVSVITSSDSMAFSVSVITGSDTVVFPLPVFTSRALIALLHFTQKGTFEQACGQKYL